MRLEISDHSLDVREVIVALGWLGSVLKLLWSNLVVASMSNEICLAVHVLLLISLVFGEVIALHRRVVSLIGGVVADLRVTHTKVSLGQLLLHSSCSVCVRPFRSAEVLVVVC